MTIGHALITLFFFTAGAFALVSIFHDLRGAWAWFTANAEEANDDDA